MRTAFGIVIASIASLLFNGAILVQARETRAVSSEHGLRASLLSSLVRRKRWLIGGALQVMGVGLQTAALLLAPLTAVQPAEAVGLLLLVLMASRMLDERASRRGFMAVCLVIVGVVGMAAVAPRRKVADLDSAKVWLSVAALLTASLVPYALPERRGAGSRWTVIGAGLSFALTAFCTKLFADALDKQAWAAMVVVAPIAAAGAVVGTLSEQSALQQRQATQVAPLIFIVELLLPIALGVGVVGESWSRSPVTITLSLALVTIGVVIIGRTPTIAQLAASSEHEHLRPGHGDRAAPT